MKRLLTITALATLFALMAAPVAAGTRDRGRPTVSFQTEHGQYFTMSQQNPLLEHMVRGVAKDKKSKIKRVVVVYKPCSTSEGRCELSELRADAYQKRTMWKSAMDCSASGRRCNWALEAPATPGYYQVKAWAYDTKGNKARTKHIRITVI